MKHVLYCAALGASAFLTTPAQATAYTISSSGDPVQIDLTLASIVPITLDVGNSAGSGYSYNQSNGLTGYVGVLGTPAITSVDLNLGALSSSASTSSTTIFHGIPSSVSGTSSVANVNLSLDLLLGALGINVTANNISSTSTAGYSAGTYYANGTSTLTNLKLTIPDGLGTKVIDLSADVNPVANFTALDLGALQVILNKQTVSNGSNGASIITDALDIHLSDYILNGNALNGDIILGASAASAPEPAAWTMMILGFGFIGSMMRTRLRRRTLTLA